MNDCFPFPQHRFSQGKWWGLLFQGRFKSILINVDDYLLELSRYILRNTVMATIRESPEVYSWRSYRAYVKGGKTIPPWLESNRLLSHFETTTRKEMNRYCRFVEETDETLMDAPETHSVAGTVLGNESFITWMQETFLKGRTDEREKPQLRTLKPGIPVDTVIQAVGAAYGCEETTITEKGRKGNRVREHAIYLSRELYGLTNIHLGQRYGGISGAAVTLTFTNLSRSLNQDKHLRIKLEEIKRQILNV
jgi:hypothetical protein